MLVKDHEKLEYSIIPNNATNKEVTWRSNNPSVAEVDSEGNVTAIKEGTATITVTTNDGSKTASCVVTVTKKDDTSGGDTSGDNSSTDDVSGDDNSGGESSEGEHSDGKDTGEDNDSSSEHGGHKPHNE